MAEELRPQYNGVLDQDGNLLGKYTLDPSSYAAPSAWAGLQRQMLSQQRLAAQDDLAASGAGSAAQARTALAMRGGLSGGSAERLAQAQTREQMAGVQKLARDEAMGNLQVASDDYQNNQKIAQYNMANAIAGLNAKNDYEMSLYQERMKAAGARDQANATRQSGKIICGELGRQGLLDEETLSADAAFGRKVFLESPEVMIGYWRLAVPVVSLMKRSSAFTRLVALFALPWSRHMAYLMGIRDRDSLIGRIVMTIGKPVCRFVGRRITAVA